MAVLPKGHPLAQHSTVDITKLENEPYYREIGIAVKDRRRMSPVTMKFFDYLKYRKGVDNG